MTILEAGIPDLTSRPTDNVHAALSIWNAPVGERRAFPVAAANPQTKNWFLQPTESDSIFLGMGGRCSIR